MKIRIAYTVDFDDDALAAFVRYHSLESQSRSEIREHIRAAYHQVGTMGVDEQMYEGGQWLENDALLAKEAAADSDDGGDDV